MFNWLRPNDLAFSCRERAATSLQNATDLAREAVGCTGGLGGRLGHLSLCARARLLVASLVELEKELLNLLATCVGETCILAYNHEPTFF